eukprot:2008448-Pyramimonas_sp.AAC.1
MPMSWTMWLGGILPSRLAVIIISFAERQIAIRSRSRFVVLNIMKISESTRRPAMNKRSAPFIDKIIKAACQPDMKYGRNIDQFGTMDKMPRCP